MVRAHRFARKGAWHPVLALVAALIAWAHDPPHADLEDRLFGLGFAWLMVIGWRLIAQMPTFGLVERLASDYRTFDAGPITAILTWIIFLLAAGAVAFF